MEKRERGIEKDRKIEKEVEKYKKREKKGVVTNTTIFFLKTVRGLTFFRGCLIRGGREVRENTVKGEKGTLN